MWKMAPALIAGLIVSPAATAQGISVASQAQVQSIDKRVGALESQMNAVQRKVFPGDKKFFQPEIVPETTAGATPAAGAPASGPIVDLTQRVTALETQQRQMTGQIEELQYKLREMQTAMDKFRGDSEFRLNALEGKGAPAGAEATVPAAQTPAAQTSAVTPPAAQKPVTPPKVEPAKPATPDDAYRLAYAKYTARDYAGASKDLSAFVAANPKHAKAADAQYWAGRAMMGDGQNAQAAKAFLAGYQNYPRSERAPSSLLWLGKSLTAMKQPKAACQALDQLKTAYPDQLKGQFATDVANARSQAKCS